MKLTKLAAAALGPLTMAAITIATAASASAAMPTVAGSDVQQPLDDPGGADPDPNFWNGGQAGGDTGPASAGTGSNSDPGSNCQTIGGATVCGQGDVRGGGGPSEAPPRPVSGPAQQGGCLTPYGTYQNCIVEGNTGRPQ